MQQKDNLKANNANKTYQKKTWRTNSK